MGSVGPIGYPGPKGLKVREYPSYVSSRPSMAGLKIILFLPRVTVLRERMVPSIACPFTQTQDCSTQHPAGGLQ